MADARLSFFEDHQLDDTQRAAAMLLPVCTRVIHWTPEENQEFTPEQKFLTLCKLNGATYKTLREYFKLGGDNVVASALKKTALGYKWSLHKIGGSSSFISEVYIIRLKNLVHERCLDLNAMRSVEVMDFIVSAIRGMYSDGYKRLNDWGCPKLAASLKIPDVQFVAGYLTHFAKRVGLFIKSPEVIDKLRRQFCNRPAIHQFFSKFAVFMANISPFFIYNADETGLSTKKSYKVFTTDPLFRATPSPGKEQHITSMCCFSATGYKMPLLMIIAGVRNIPFASEKDPCFYATSPSGWMSEHLFNVWAIIFVSHIQHKRNALPERERNIPFVLFLDGHASRMSPFALRFFNKYNIIVIIFPAHASHVLQPFDVSIAAPLKSSYIKFLLKNLKYYTLFDQSQVMQARYARVRAFQDAWCCVTPTDCQKAFKAAGIYPFDENAVSMQHLIHPTGTGIYAGRTSILSSNNVSAADFIQRIPAYVRRIRWDDGSIFDIQPEVNYTEAEIVWNTKVYEVGRVWHTFPQFPTFQ